MTRAPRRWVDDAANAPPGAGDLLRAAATPDPAARLRMWNALQSCTATTAATAATAATAKAATSGGLLALVGVKPAVVAALFVAGSVALHHARSVAPPAPRPVATVTIAARTAAPTVPIAEPPTVIPVPVKPPTPVLVIAAPRRVARPVVVARAHAVAPAAVVTVAPFTVDDELAAYASARSLVATDPAAALAAFDALSARLGRDGGALAHERARYAVDALRRLHRDDEARARADAFLAAHPTSTVAPAMRAIAEREVR